MKLRHTYLIIVTLTFALLCAACTSTPSLETESTTPAISPTPATVEPTPEFSPTPDETPEEPSLFLDGDNYPREIEIEISREGDIEILTAELRVSDLGYAIYVLPEFEFVPAGWDHDYDTIRPDSDSGMLSEMTMTITPVDTDSPLPENYESEGLFSRYDRVSIDGLVFEVQFTYPLEAAEGGAVLLQAMWETVTR